jgi:hypothetical protein
MNEEFCHIVPLGFDRADETCALWDETHYSADWTGSMLLLGLVAAWSDDSKTPDLQAVKEVCFRVCQSHIKAGGKLLEYDANLDEKSSSTPAGRDPQGRTLGPGTFHFVVFSDGPRKVTADVCRGVMARYRKHVERTFPDTTAGNGQNGQRVRYIALLSDDDR